MLFAEAILGPGIRVSTVTAPTNVPLEPDFVALVISQLKALLTDNTRGILLAGLALPGNITVVECLRANSFPATRSLLELFSSALVVYLAEQELVALIEIWFEC